MTPHELLTLSATHFLATSTNASYSAESAVRDALAIRTEIAKVLEPDADWLRPLERSLGLPASGCAEVDDAA